MAALAGSAILLSYDRRIAVAAVVGTAGAFVLLRARGIRHHGGWPRARRAARRTELRMAVANIHRPGALTPSLVLSLGLGVTLLVTLAVIDATIRGQLTAPSREGAELLLPRRAERGGGALRRASSPRRRPAPRSSACR